MNSLEAYVTKILDGPFVNTEYAFEGVILWGMQVEYECWGTKDSRTLYFETKEEAEALKIGHKFFN